MGEPRKGKAAAAAADLSNPLTVLTLIRDAEEKTTARLTSFFTSIISIMQENQTATRTAYEEGRGAALAEAAAAVEDEGDDDEGGVGEIGRVIEGVADIFKSIPKKTVEGGGSGNPV